MKKSVTSFIAVMLIIIFFGVTAVTGVYIPGGWTMPFRNHGNVRHVCDGYERYLVYRQQRRQGGQHGRQHGCVC